jgi:hypothetical protein
MTGSTNFVGWIDMRSFTSTITGATHTTLIDTLSTNPITAGWQVGDTVAGAGVVANTDRLHDRATSSRCPSARRRRRRRRLTVTSGTKAAPRLRRRADERHAPGRRADRGRQFNGRAYYAVANGVQFSDA